MPDLELEATMNGPPLGKPYDVSIPEQPITEQLKPYVPRSSDTLIDAGVARATIAPTKENPDGTMQDEWAKTHQHQTVQSPYFNPALHDADLILKVIQQHVEYFDRDGDGIIWPLDTYQGFRGWGFIFPLAVIAMIIIHGALSFATVPSFFPDPLCRIYVKNVHLNKHGSDSMTYDAEGRFRPQHFEDFFAKYDKDNKGGLTKGEIWYGLKGQRFAWDFFGWSAAFLECKRHI